MALQVILSTYLEASFLSDVKSQHVNLSAVKLFKQVPLLVEHFKYQEFYCV